jgi:predicted RND superfamily exporter protein
MASLTEAQKQDDRALFQESLDHMTSFAGADAAFVQMLKQKMITNEEAVKRNPLKSVQEVVKLLTMLLRGSAEEKEAARKAIQNLSPEDEADQQVDLPEFTQTLESRFADIKDGLNSEMEELDDEVHESAEVMQTLTSKGNSSALLEKSDGTLQIKGETVVSGIAFVVIVLLVVAAIVWTILEILAAIIAWAVLSVVGCGAYAAGHNYAISKNELPSEARMGVLGTMKCIAKVFTVPFVLIYKGGKAISRAFRPKKQISSPPQEDQAQQ